jgi:hypothetical protein
MAMDLEQATVKVPLADNFSGWVSNSNVPFGVHPEGEITEEEGNDQCSCSDGHGSLDVDLD